MPISFGVPCYSELATGSLLAHIPLAGAALVLVLLGEQQMLALADYVQAALMLNYNKRTVG